MRRGLESKRWAVATRQGASVNGDSPPLAKHRPSKKVRIPLSFCKGSQAQKIDYVLGKYKDRIFLCRLKINLVWSTLSHVFNFLAAFSW